MDPRTAEELAVLTHDHALKYLIGGASLVTIVLLAVTMLIYFWKPNKGVLAFGGLCTIFGFLVTSFFVTDYNTQEYYAPLASRVAHDIVDQYYVQEASFNANPKNVKALLNPGEKKATVEVLLQGDEQHTYTITLNEQGNAVLDEPQSVGASQVMNLRKG